MLALRFAVLAVAVLAAGCSSGHAKQSTPTTRAVAPVAVDLGPCPKQDPTGSLAKSNAGVSGLDQNLVPIIASRVRICSYEHHSSGSATVGSPAPSVAVARLRDEANGLRRQPIGTWSGRCVKYPGTLFVTFASDAQRVDLLTKLGCDSPVTNGVLYVRATTKWLNELLRYATHR